MKIVCISDTHSLHDKISLLPKGDVIVHAGDFTNIGSPEDAANFIDWFSALEFKHKILVAGNHDGVCEDRPVLFGELLKHSGIVYLQDSGVVINGISFYGSPFTPTFNNWWFMCDRDLIHPIWKKIPQDTDVLITHGPPRGCVDMIFNPRTSEYDNHIGCEVLAGEIQKKNVKHHVCGHIHGGYGEAVLGITKIHNVSICDEGYNPVNPPTIIKFEKP